MRVALVLTVCLFAVACPPPCGPSSCSGCCASDGTCVEGTLRLECGRDGVACAACARSETCTEGTCFMPPTVDAGPVDAGPVVCKCATSCCTPDGKCGPSNDPLACGTSGQFCTPCPTGDRCEFGTCLSSSCPGCFDPLGVCRAGIEVGSCGVGGGLCVACGINQECQGRRCVFTKCDATTCRFGCCMPDLRCELVTGPTACGLNGDRCSNCGDAGQCLAGACF